MSVRLRAAGLTAAAAFAFQASPAGAHAISGVRVFPVTLTLDDPGVADEVTLPQVTWQRDAGPQDLTQIQWEFDKTITPDTALIYNHGYDILSQAGQKTRTGFENAVITGKWQAWVVPEREFMMSVGVQREFAGGYNTVAVGGDAYGSTAPTVYFGKGLGDLPIGNFRPLAVTGEFSYVIADRRLNLAADNSGSPNGYVGGLSIQYSVPYLQQQVKDYGLGEFFGRMIPLVEFDWFSPSSKAPGNPATFQIAPGVIWLGDTYQVGLEALIPGNTATGHNVGVIAQVHFFLDDIFPNTLGKPLFE